jgi:integrase
MAVRNGKADRSRLAGSDSSELSLDQAFDIYTNDRSKALVAGGVKESSMDVYRKQWKKFREFTGARRISHMGQINKELLNEYSRWLEDKGTAPNYVSDLVTLLLQLINTLIDTNHLDPSRRIRMKMKKFEADEAYCYTAEEFRTMLNQCAGHKDPRVRQVGKVIMVLGYTGLRINELLSLQWHHIDLEARFITVKDDSAKAKSEENRQSTKSSRSRRVPIHKELLRWFRTGNRKKIGPLFLNDAGEPLTYGSARDAFTRKVRAPLAGRFPGKPGEKSFQDGCFHSLRHFFCSRHAQQGVPEMVMCKWLGHQSSRITRRYYHNNDQESLRLIDGVDVLGSHSKAGKSLAGARDRSVVGRSKGRQKSEVRRKRKAS